MIDNVTNNIIVEDKDYNTALYVVNLATGAATKIADSEITMYGMVIAPTPANINAPAVVSNLSAVFSGTSLNGVINFILPNKTVKGDALNGNVDYVVTANGKQLFNGTEQPGTTGALGKESREAWERQEKECDLWVSWVYAPSILRQCPRCFCLRFAAFFSKRSCCSWFLRSCRCFLCAVLDASICSDST